MSEAKLFFGRLAPKGRLHAVGQVLRGCPTYKIRLWRAKGVRRCRKYYPKGGDFRAAAKRTLLRLLSKFGLLRPRRKTPVQRPKNKTTGRGTQSRNFLFAQSGVSSRCSLPHAIKISKFQICEVFLVCLNLIDQTCVGGRAFLVKPNQTTTCPMRLLTQRFKTLAVTGVSGFF